MWNWNAKRPAILWEGPFDGSFSFSVINIELCRRLARSRAIDLSISPVSLPKYSGKQNVLAEYQLRSLKRLINKPFNHPVDVHVRYLARDRYQPPQEGRWVVIQPWDYGPLPAAWMEWLNRVDEIWVPSSFMRDGYLESRIDSDKIYVIPNGVNTRLFHPNARKLRLKTKKSYKFLYMGGGLWRKGFDLMLKAYTQAFTSADDVCLIIKSIPEFWGEESTSLVNEYYSQPNRPEIEVIVQTVEPLYLAGLYAACNCLVHPYRAEGFVIPVAEAMACGLPVIVTDKGATRDYCTNETAVLIDSKWVTLKEKRVEGKETVDYPRYLEPELDSLIEALRAAYSRPQSIYRRARLGRDLIRSAFTWDHAVTKVVTRLGKLSEREAHPLV